MRLLPLLHCIKLVLEKLKKDGPDRDLPAQVGWRGGICGSQASSGPGHEQSRTVNAARGRSSGRSLNFSFAVMISAWQQHWF